MWHIVYTNKSCFCITNDTIEAFEWNQLTAEEPPSAVRVVILTKLKLIKPSHFIAPGAFASSFQRATRKGDLLTKMMWSLYHFMIDSFTIQAIKVVCLHGAMVDCLTSVSSSFLAFGPVSLWLHYSHWIFKSLFHHEFIFFMDLQWLCSPSFK